MLIIKEKKKEETSKSKKCKLNKSEFKFNYKIGIRKMTLMDNKNNWSDIK